MPKPKDLTGMRSGRLVVEKMLDSIRSPQGKLKRRCLCLCDCGNESIVLAENISNNRIKSCGCLRSETASKQRTKDLTNQIIGRWFIEGIAFRDRAGVHWNAICQCGNRGTPTTNNLLRGISTSCGCYNLERLSEIERKDITDQRFYKLVAKECVGKNEYNNYLWKCICDCGREVTTTAARLLGGQIISCGCVKSKGECLIENFFAENNIKYNKTVYFKDLKLKTYLYFDFCIYDKENKQHLIEYQGEQHYIDRGSFGKQQREVTDKMKKEYCLSKNIPLYEIRFDEDIYQKLNEIITHVNPVLSKQTA